MGQRGGGGAERSDIHVYTDGNSHLFPDGMKNEVPMRSSACLKTEITLPVLPILRAALFAYIFSKPQLPSAQAGAPGINQRPVRRAG